ncbi:MAG: hypothetical protein U0U67_11795 [Chitinophagales bacterium]
MENKITQHSFNTVLENTLQTCNTDENYQQYSSREKMLAFVFTFLQNLDETDSSFIQQNRVSFLQPIKTNLNNYFEELIFDATNSGEVQARPFIANYYKSVLNTAFLSILNFWSNDKSANKENTDVMVEKTVHFAFDILAPNAIDSGFDLAQNLFKLSRKK